jgi:hypothetical protein
MKVLLVVLLFAAVTYLAIRWLQDRGPGNGGTPARRAPSRPPSRPVAPDDDPTFLRDLEWKRRQADRHKHEPPPPGPRPEPRPEGKADAPTDRPAESQADAPADDPAESQADTQADNPADRPQPDGQ